MLKDKKVLITAGPVWVPIDRVRVITNIFSGELGYVIAKAFAKQGAIVTLLMGPGRMPIIPEQEKFSVIRFRYFDEILDLVKTEIGSQNYEVMIHSAAVSDYQPKERQTGKIKSGQGSLQINFKPTVKIVDLVKDLDPNIFLIKFKLEVGVAKSELVEIAYQSMLDSRADLIVANEFGEATADQHRAYIIDQNKNIIDCLGKNNIAEQLITLLNKQK